MLSVRVVSTRKDFVLKGCRMSDMVQPPARGLKGNSNYFLYSNCNPLTNLSVAIAVTEDVVGSEGVGIQLCAYSAPGYTAGWQQWMMGIGKDHKAINWCIQIFASSGAKQRLIAPGDPTWWPMPSLTLPKGYTLTISLDNDPPTQKLIGATFSVIDHTGKTVATHSETIAQESQAPIIGFRLNLVGPTGDVLSSGAGTITYTASNQLTVLGQKPPCPVDYPPTAEDTNTVYGTLPQTPSTKFVQTFGVSLWPLSLTERLAQRVGDFDGDGLPEVLFSSSWGIGLLKQQGASLTSLAMAANGTRVGNWLIETADDTFATVADFDGDGRDEILVSNASGVGILKLSAGALTTLAKTSNGRLSGGWNLQTAANRFGIAADYDGDKHDEILVTSDWGVGILKLVSGGLTTLLLQPNGTFLGQWNLNAQDNAFVAAGDFDGDGQAEILVTSAWGIGVLKRSGNTLDAPVVQPNGVRFGSWLLETSANQFGPVGHYDGDGRDEILVTSAWGIAILKLSGTTLATDAIEANGTRLGEWKLESTANRFGSLGSFKAATQANLLVTSPWGIGILKLGGGTLESVLLQPNGTRLGQWLLDTNDDVI
jgi:hypothetical protein